MSAKLQHKVNGSELFNTYLKSCCLWLDNFASEEADTLHAQHGMMPLQRYHMTLTKLLCGQRVLILCLDLLWYAFSKLSVNCLL